MRHLFDSSPPRLSLCWLVSPTCAAAEPNWPDHLTIGTASPGGTYYVYGEGLAKILTRALDLPVVRQTTEGPLQNIELLEAGQIQLGFVTMGVALQAWNATGVWAGRAPARAMRAIFPMYDTPFQFLVLQESGIRSIADIAGKRVGVGPHGGTSATYVPQFFSVLNVAAELHLWRLRRPGDADCRTAQIDAFFAAAGRVHFHPSSSSRPRTKVRYLRCLRSRSRRCASPCRS